MMSNLILNISTPIYTINIAIINTKGSKKASIKAAIRPLLKYVSSKTLLICRNSFISSCCLFSNKIFFSILIFSIIKFCMLSLLLATTLPKSFKSLFCFFTINGIIEIPATVTSTSSFDIPNNIIR